VPEQGRTRENRIPIPATTVAPRTKELFERAAAKFGSNGLFLDAVMTALQGLIEPEGPPAKRKKRRVSKKAPRAAGGPPHVA